MILTTHALVGAAIGKNVKKTWLIILIALASHFLLDSFRHGEYITDLDWGFGWLKIALDHIIGFSIIALSIFITKPEKKIIINILLGTFFAMLPDLFTVFYQNFNFNFLGFFVEFGKSVHPYPTGSPETFWTLHNALNDILFSLIALYCFFFIKQVAQKQA